MSLKLGQGSVAMLSHIRGGLLGDWASGDVEFDGEWYGNRVVFGSVDELCSFVGKEMTWNEVLSNFDPRPLSHQKFMNEP